MKSTTLSGRPFPRGKSNACCGHAFPNFATVREPVYGSTGTGRLNLRSPMLDNRGQLREREVTAEETYGGFAKGIPRNLFVKPSVVPMKVPLSSWRVGEVPDVAGAANAAPTRTATESRRRMRERVNMAGGGGLGRRAKMPCCRHLEPGDW